MSGKGKERHEGDGYKNGNVQTEKEEEKGLKDNGDREGEGGREREWGRGER